MPREPKWLNIQRRCTHTSALLHAFHQQHPTFCHVCSQLSAKTSSSPFSHGKTPLRGEQAKNSLHSRTLHQMQSKNNYPAREKTYLAQSLKARGDPECKVLCHQETAEHNTVICAIRCWIKDFLSFSLVCPKTFPPSHLSRRSGDGQAGGEGEVGKRTGRGGRKKQKRGGKMTSEMLGSPPLRRVCESAA